MSDDMVEITAELIAQGMTGPGGWIAEQLRLIGAWPCRSGWRQRVIGRQITQAEANAFVSGRKLGPDDSKAARRTRIAVALAPRNRACQLTEQPRREPIERSTTKLGCTLATAGDTACPLCHGSKRTGPFVDATGRSTGEPCALCADAPADNWELLHIVSLSLEGATKPRDALIAVQTAKRIFRFSPSSFAGVADRQSAAVAGFLRQLARILKPEGAEGFDATPPWQA
jgi:hypothetical protein